MSVGKIPKFLISQAPLQLPVIWPIPDDRGAKLVQTVEDLDVFKLSHETALAIYKITKTFPEDERFGLISQMRRAAYSIPMNIAEGAGRLSRGEYRQFAGVARGSASELKYQLFLAKGLGYIRPKNYENLRSGCERISQMLTALIKSLAGK